MKIFSLLILGFVAIKANALFAQRTFDSISYGWSAVWRDAAVLVAALLWVYGLRKIVGREHGPIDLKASSSAASSWGAKCSLIVLGLVISLGAANIEHLLLKWPHACEGDAVKTMQHLGLLTPENFAQQMAQATFADFLPFIVALTLLTPIAEEIVFRREALGYLLRSKSISMAICIQGVAFALIHIRSATAFVTILIVGLALGAIQVIGKDLRLPIIVHGIYNLSLITPIHGRIFATKDPAQLCGYQAWLPEIISLSLAIPAAIILVVWLRKEWVRG